MSESPDRWQVPVWHPDFGDPNIEFADLRRLAEYLISLRLIDSVALETPEPGLMFLRAVTQVGTEVEIYSVSGLGTQRDRRFGIFIAPNSPSEIEAYANTDEEAANILISHSA